MKLLQIRDSEGKLGSSLVQLDKIDIENLNSIPDEELKIRLCMVYSKKLTDEQVALYTGKDVALVEKIRGEKSKKQKVELKDEKPFDPKETFNKLATSDDKLARIMALYWAIKELKIETKQDYRALYSPYNIKMAKALDVYDLSTIKKAIEEAKRFAEEKQFAWDLTTVGKFASKIAGT